MLSAAPSLEHRLLGKLQERGLPATGTGNGLLTLHQRGQVHMRALCDVGVGVDVKAAALSAGL